MNSSISRDAGRAFIIRPVLHSPTVSSRAFDVAEHTARLGRVRIDEGYVVPRENPAHSTVIVAAIDDLVGVVDHHAIAAEGTERDEPVADDVGDRIRAFETLACVGAHEDGRRLAVDAL